MIPDWDLFSEIDSRLAGKDFLIILLYYNEKLFEDRAIRRVDRKNENGTNDSIVFWGSFEKALDACRVSQNRRIDCLNLSKVNHLKIDTSDKRWADYANDIARYIA